MKSRRIVMCDTHCPSNLIIVAGSLDHSERKDGKAAQFSGPSDSSIWNNLFVCDSFNHCTRIIDMDIIVSRKRGRENCLTAGEDSVDIHAETDDTRQTEKTASVRTLSLLSLTQSTDALGYPAFAICVGRKLLTQYPDLYITDTQYNRVFRIGGVSNASNNTFRGCLTAIPLPRE